MGIVIYVVKLKSGIRRVCGNLVSGTQLLLEGIYFLDAKIFLPQTMAATVPSGNQRMTRGGRAWSEQEVS